MENYINTLVKSDAGKAAIDMALNKVGPALKTLDTKKTVSAIAALGLGILAFKGIKWFVYGKAAAAVVTKAQELVSTKTKAKAKAA